MAHSPLFDVKTLLPGDLQTVPGLTKPRTGQPTHVGHQHSHPLVTVFLARHTSNAPLQGVQRGVNKALKTSQGTVPAARPAPDSSKGQAEWVRTDEDIVKYYEGTGSQAAVQFFFCNR
jgi:hypothetical protein